MSLRRFSGLLPLGVAIVAISGGCSDSKPVTPAAGAGAAAAPPAAGSAVQDAGPKPAGGPRVAAPKKGPGGQPVKQMPAAPLAEPL